MENSVKIRHAERGSAGVKLVIALAILAFGAHAGYNYVPVAYDAAALKSDMETAVLQGLAMPGKINPVDNVKERIARSITLNNIPKDAIVDVKQVGNSITARVTYSQPVHIMPFGLYTYNYGFDYTATPTGFLLKQ